MRDIKQQEHLIMGLELTSDVRIAAYDLTMARPLNLAFTIRESALVLDSMIKMVSGTGQL
jgi:hypothetical protein